MSQSTEGGVVDFDLVRQRELEQIVARRKTAFRDDQPDPENVEQNLVGLALSGGGIRSAAISLGVLQRLFGKGILRLVDYLSTVSGGGYAGAYLSTSALKAASNHRQRASRDAQEPDVGTQATAHSSADSRLAESFAPLETGEEPERIQKFIFGSRYLRRPLAFASRYACSLIVMLAMYLSGLVMLSALVAYCYGLLWQPSSVVVIHSLGFNTDIGVALFPAFVVLALWLLAWGISYFRYAHRSAGRVARVLFIVFLFVTAVGVAGLFGTGDISLTQLSTYAGSSPKGMLGSFGDTFKVLLFSAIGASLLPYLTPQSLLRSGIAPRNNLDRATFWFASRALVFGIPFVFIAWFAQENISGYNDTRGDRFVPTDIDGWKTKEAWAPFWVRIKNEAELETERTKAANPPDGSEWPSVAARIWAKNAHYTVAKPKDSKQTWARAQLLPSGTGGVGMDKAFGTLTSRINDIKQYEAKASYGRGWWHLSQFLVNSAIGNRSDACGSDYYKFCRARLDCRDIKEGITAALNEVLEDPSLCQSVPYSDKVMDLKRQAQQLQSQAGPPAATPESQANAQLSEELKASVVAVNRKLLNELYGKEFRDSSIVFAAVVLDDDQHTRRNWFLGTLPVFLLLLVFVNLNATSLHGFYAEEVAGMWLEDVPGMPETGVTLAAMNTVDAGFPYHLISATWHRLGRRDTSKDSSDREQFLFSQLHCGTDRLGYARTAGYMRGQYTLADALGVSGGALNPLQVNQPLVKVLLLLANMRLGQWIDNPRVPRKRWTQHLPLSSYLPYTPLKMILSFISKAENRDRCFVSDGGLYENLGIEPLLRRRCRLIIALDAAQDEEFAFGDFSKLLRWAKVRHGVTLEALQPSDDAPPNVDLSRLIPLRDDATTSSNVIGAKKSADGKVSWERLPVSKTHHLVFRIRYPEAANSPADAYLVYIKSSITGDEPQSLLGHIRRHDSFPHDSTTNQYFDATTFESYRHLGSHMAGSSFPGDYGNLSSARSASSAYDWFFKQFKAGAAGKKSGEPEVDAELEKLLAIVLDKQADVDEREAAIVQISNSQHDPRHVISGLVGILGDANEALVKLAVLVLTEYGSSEPRLFVQLGMQVESSTRARIELAALAAEVLGHDVDVDRQIIEVLAEWTTAGNPKTLQKAARSALREYSFSYRHDGRLAEQVARANQILHPADRANVGKA